MTSERRWRNTAIVLCAAVPLSFYLLGDLADAFPGVLTVARTEATAPVWPDAAAEDWDRVAPVVPTPGAAAPGSEGSDGSGGSDGDATVAGTIQAPPTLDEAGLAARMAAPASLPVVEGRLSFSVVEAAGGGVVAERDADTALVPASTLKLLTAAAVLRERDPGEVLVTRALVGEGTVALVGEGDMTLTDEDLRTLAEDAAVLVREEGEDPVRVVLAPGAIVGGENPAWGDNGTAGGWVAPTAPLALDRGWLDGEAYGAKSADPAQDAADRFAELLAEQGIAVEGEVTRGDAPVGGAEARVGSAPLGDLVRDALLTSDNTLAELLAHLTAEARGEPTTPAGAAAAVDAEIRELGAELGVDPVVLEDLVVRDGSGLSRENRVPPALLSAVLADVASGRIPALQQILLDVPVAGLSGTLADRFTEEGAEDGRGVLRGKTGYLGGTAALAGVTVLADGRTVGYVIVVHGFDGADAAAAREAVDLVAVELVRAS